MWSMNPGWVKERLRRRLADGAERDDDSRSIARAAARLVRVERADLDRRAVERRRLSVDEPLRPRCGAAADVADRLELVDELREAEQQRHRPERLAPEVAVEPGRDDALAARDALLNRVDELRLEELRLVDTDDVVAVRPPKRLLDSADGDRAHPRAGVADDVGDVVAVVDPRLHDQDVLPGDLRPTEAPDELLALAAEHGAADHFEPAAAAGDGTDHGAGPYKEVPTAPVVSLRACGSSSCVTRRRRPASRTTADRSPRRGGSTPAGSAGGLRTTASSRTPCCRARSCGRGRPQARSQRPWASR